MLEGRKNSRTVLFMTATIEMNSLFITVCLERGNVLLELSGKQTYDSIAGKINKYSLKRFERLLLSRFSAHEVMRIDFIAYNCFSNCSLYSVTVANFR